MTPSFVSMEHCVIVSPSGNWLWNSKAILPGVQRLEPSQRLTVRQADPLPLIAVPTQVERTSPSACRHPAPTPDPTAPSRPRAPLDRLERTAPHSRPSPGPDPATPGRDARHRFMHRAHQLDRAAGFGLFVTINGPQSKRRIPATTSQAARPLKYSRPGRGRGASRPPLRGRAHRPRRLLPTRIVGRVSVTLSPVLSAAGNAERSAPCAHFSGMACRLQWEGYFQGINTCAGSTQ